MLVAKVDSSRQCDIMQATMRMKAFWSARCTSMTRDAVWKNGRDRDVVPGTKATL